METTTKGLGFGVQHVGLTVIPSASQLRQNESTRGCYYIPEEGLGALGSSVLHSCPPYQPWNPMLQPKYVGSTL